MNSTPPPVLPATVRSSSPPASTIARAATEHPATSVAVAIVAVTLLGAITSMLVPELGPARAPRPTLRGTPGEAVAIAVTNAQTLLAPLLLSAGRWHTSRVTRRLGDVVVAAIVIANAALIGFALGRHPIALLAYLPHLPLEDAALATAAAAWVTRRAGERAGPPPRSVAAYAGLTLALTVLAAFVETYAVPHKG